MHRRTSLENTQSIRKCLSSVNILMRVNLAKAWKADHSLSRCFIIIAEDEAEIIRIIYDKFANITMGMAAIAAFLNNSGYKKKLRQNNTIEGFSTSFVRGVLDNPIYCGKLAFGRRKNGFLCEVFHPAVRYEKGYWKEFLTEINKLLQNDGYELCP